MTRVLRAPSLPVPRSGCWLVEVTEDRRARSDATRQACVDGRGVHTGRMATLEQPERTEEASKLARRWARVVEATRDPVLAVAYVRSELLEAPLPLVAGALDVVLADATARDAASI